MGSIGPYAVVRELARGGMGAVLHGRAADGRDVAIKVLLRPGAKDAVARFGRERRLLAQLGEEQGFVPILDSGEDSSGPYLVMPLVPGGTLRARLEAGPMPVGEAVSLVAKLARAAGRAHALGIVHRDLKPENVLFTAAGEPLVTDLGLAKHFAHDLPGASASIALSKTGEFKGTLGYMAPEQTGAAREAGPPADVFALGAILYECLAGRSPFDGESPSEVLAKVASDTVTPVRSLRPDTPRWLSAVLARALRRDPRRRYPDGASLALALAHGPRDHRRRVLSRLVAASFALGFVGAAVVASRGGARPRLAGVAPVASERTPRPRESARPHDSQRPRAPEWYLALPESERPALPLPAGLVFGDEPRVYRNEKDGSELVFVPAGVYLVGTTTDEATMTHEVQLSSYFMGRTELTVERFARFAAETRLVTLAEKEGGTISFGWDESSDTRPSVTASFRRPDGETAADPREPVAQVTWSEAEAYCRWAGLALPSEAQWEVAAGWDPRAKRSHDYPWGADGRPEVVARGGKPWANLMDATFVKVHPLVLSWYEGYDDGWAHAAPVGTFPDGVSPSGCLDMCGNVREWMRDDYDLAFYKRSPRFDPVGDAPPDLGGIAYRLQVVRGGGFASSTQWGETWHRSHARTEFRAWDLGFRVSRAGR